MGALSRAMTLALSVGLVGCTIKTMPLVGEPASLAGAQDSATLAPPEQAVVTAPKPVLKEYGWLNLSIRWPDQSDYRVALLPTTTNAIALWVKKDSVTLGSPTVVSRQSGAATATMSIRVEAASNLSVEIKAYRETAPDLATAVPIAQKAGVVNVVRSKVTPLSLTLDPLTVPTVTGFSQNVGWVGDTITVVGTLFGSGSVPVPTVTFNGATATSVTRNSESSLTVVVPPGATTGNVVVKADGVDSKSLATFWVLSAFDVFARKAAWDNGPSNQYMVLYGQTLQFQHSETWALKTSETVDPYLPAPSVTWSSSHPTAGTLDSDGLFTAATSFATSSIRASVGPLQSGAVQAVAVGVNDVTLDRTALTLNAMPPEGAPDPGYVTSATLVATVNTTAPFNNRVSWASSDTSRVTVLDGLVQTTRGAAPGTVTLTATSIDDPTKKATASVTVTSNGGLVLGIQ